MKRGHSNVKAALTRPWDQIDPKVDPGVARIPLFGGATIESTKELPPLALDHWDWEEIGRKMGWLKTR
jgi:hypothetical protein